ncbi:MAG: hypothetical protein WA919_10850 [Coleofasciculaceae cyanobacterium]
MPKEELYQEHFQVPPSSNQEREHQPVNRRAEETNVSSVEATAQLGAVSQEEQQKTTSSELVLIETNKSQGHLWSWWLFWLIVISTMAGFVASGILWLTKLPPPVDCQKTSPLSPDGDRLYCAQQAAESGELEKYIEAINLVKDWPNQHPFHSEAERLLGSWSEAIMDFAEQKIKQGFLSEAVKIAQQIPTHSPSYPEVQKTIATWQEEWQRLEGLVSKFKDALKTQNWEEASSLTTTLAKSNLEYWSSTRVDQLMEHLLSEKQAWEQLEEARNLASSGRVRQLKEAIALAAKIEPNSYVKADALSEQSNWSRALLDIAAERFDDQDFTSVIEIAQHVPVNAKPYQEAQDWIYLGRASMAAEKGNMLALLDAIAAVGQISQQSPLNQFASAQTVQWQSDLQDQAQLQLARIMANNKQQEGLKLAIDAATSVKLGSPQRILAQTLIAQWRKEIQEIEDRNNLLLAQQLAESRTLGFLKEAVEVANQIESGQPLYIEATNEIANWQQQIQILEDKPILDLARTFAQRRDLMGAIATAGRIRPERVLYPEAQEAIANWEAQIQIAQDRPILEAAAALAAQGRLDAAIATASHISPERALYDQAQLLQSTWRERKEAISRESELSLPWQN